MSNIGFGLDFGTTNSSIAAVDPDGNVRLAQFDYSGGFTEAFRSLLYLEQIRSAGRVIVRPWTGPKGIDQYLRSEHKGRLIQSLKSFLTSRSLQSTDVFGRRYTLEDLISFIVRDIRSEAERQFGTALTEIVVGRPIRFVGSETAEDDLYAQSRLEIALRKAGFERITFELEPVGAAYYYESTLDHDELILIGDFEAAPAISLCCALVRAFGSAAESPVTCWGMRASASPAIRLMQESSGIWCRPLSARVRPCAPWRRFFPCPSGST